MPDVRLTIPDDLLGLFNDKIAEPNESLKATDIARDALSLYQWCVEEASQGRAIVS